MKLANMVMFAIRLTVELGTSPAVAIAVLLEVHWHTMRYHTRLSELAAQQIASRAMMILMEYERNLRELERVEAMPV